jgi:hypothetical protein
VISAGALTPVLVCFHKLEITPLSNFNHSRDGTGSCFAMDDPRDRSSWRARRALARSLSHNPSDVLLYESRISLLQISCLKIAAIRGPHHSSTNNLDRLH